MELAWLAAFATAICFGISALFEDRGAKRSTVERGVAGAGRSVLAATMSWPYMVGMTLSIGGWALSLLALQRLPLFAVQAIGASSIGLVVIVHRLQTHAAAPRRESLLLVALGLGLVALAVSAEPDEPATVGHVFDAAIWIGVAVVGVLAVVGFRTSGDSASALLGAVSGLAYAGTALCARALQTDHTLRGLLLDPLTIALLPFAVLGVATFAGALQRGSVSVATATQHAVMTVVPAAVGLAVLGDHARPGFAAVAGAGFVLTVGSVLGLTVTRSSLPIPAAVPKLSPPAA
jgi:hypothetical protein